METLKVYDEEIYHAVLNCTQTEMLYCPEKVQARDGVDITRLRVGDKLWYLNSQYHPLQETETFAEQYREVLDYSFMVFLGLGNGMFARQLQKKMEGHVRFLFFEPSKEIFIHTLNNYDISDLLKRENIHIVVEGLNEDRFEPILMSNIEITNYKLAIYDALPKYRQLFSECFQRLEKEYCEAVERVVKYLHTEFLLGREMAINAIYNMRHLLNCNYRDDFNGKFPLDIPAVVVSAGPSLEKNVQILKEMKGKAFIVAVDTALGYLSEQGIRPDLAVTVDAKKPLHLFEDKGVREMQLVMDASANRKAVDLLSGHKVILSGGWYAYYQRIFRVVNKRFDILENGGSVATTAFSLLKEWGFRRIVLVGQDLAVAPDKVHAGKDTVDLGKLDIDKIAIEGYYGDVVYTTWDYNEYRKWFEKIIAEEGCPEVINATEGGAKIAGAVQMSLKKVMDTYCGKEFDFEKAIQDVPVAFTEEDRPKLLDMWNDTLQNLAQIKSRFKESIRLVDEELRIIQQGVYRKDELMKLHTKLGELTRENEECAEFQLLESLIATEESDVLEDMYEVEASEDAEHCRLLKKSRHYINSMIAAVDEAKELFEVVIQEMTTGEEKVYGE
jgi:hypothetical protein